jgi:lipopolysaccharide/colanic/teichoic acid biosynthesis glycosyltransferase
MQVYRNFLKRGIDLGVSFVAICLLSPVMLGVAFFLLIANQGKPFFFQRRPGKNGRIFMLVKFKTMNDRRDAAGNLLPDEKRLTSVGKFIRKTSLDEIPQLINVLKGDMSLIGPRPLLVEYLPLYSPFQNRRHEVRPGITGWAQVNGRNAISWEKKFELDVWYADHISPALDARIIWLTIKKVFKTEGISQDGHATMPHFKGSKS